MKIRAVSRGREAVLFLCNKHTFILEKEELLKEEWLCIVLFFLKREANVNCGFYTLFCINI